MDMQRVFSREELTPVSKSGPAFISGAAPE